MGVPHLFQDDLNRFRLPLPPPSEQIAIATFLDRETAKIDALVEEQQRLIALLKEKRQAVISHAVTKGLDAKVPMKDSGVEWLGEVPAHWQSVQLRRVLSDKLTNGIFKRKEEFGSGTLLINVFDIYQSDFTVKSDNLERVNCDKDEVKKYAACHLDILIVRSSLKVEGVGVSAIVDAANEERVFECHLIKARFSHTETNPRYLSYLLNSEFYRWKVISEAKITTMTTVDQETIASTPLILPPLNEQNEIADRLDRESVAIDSLCGEAESAILLLQERRSALIAAAVTGKIDVRGLAPTAAKAANPAEAA